MTFRKVRAGERLDISAAAWNAVQDVARTARMRFDGDGAFRSGWSAPSANILVKNDSGAAVNQYSILGISSSLFTAGSDAFLADMAVSGITPNATTHENKFLITTEPIAAGAVGLAVAAGACICKVNITSASHDFAKPGSTSAQLTSAADSGPARMIYKESGTGVKWAIVVFPAGGTTTSEAADICTLIKTLAISRGLNKDADYVLALRGTGDDDGAGNVDQTSWDCEFIEIVAPCECATAPLDPPEAP